MAIKGKRIVLSITDMLGNLRYLTIMDSGTSLVSASQIPLSLANVAKDAFMLDYRLRKVKTATEALSVAREFIDASYKIEVVD